jgi:hypothetical protein
MTGVDPQPAPSETATKRASSSVFDRRRVPTASMVFLRSCGDRH